LSLIVLVRASPVGARGLPLVAASSQSLLAN